MKRILATGAHYDDIEVGVGGTLIKHIDNGDIVYLAIVESDEYRTGEPTKRLEEQKEVLKKISLDEKRLLLFTSKHDVNSVIFDLDRIKPDIVYTPYERDTHQAHRRCSEIAQSVGRKKNITTIFYYCGSSIEFYPNMFSMVDFKKKLELIKCHKSQIDCGSLKLSLREKMESYWASLVSLDENAYAEGLIVRKMIYEI
jgi:LmbE family N-acetylglucosaminyl deacetylase